MPRVFLTCGDAAFFETLRNSFQAEGNFEVCVEHRKGIEAILEAIELFPDLVILGKVVPPIDEFEVAEALKLSLPEVQVFLVSEIRGMEAEKKALSNGTRQAIQECNRSRG
jgi:chemotaxis response regulator CheB